MSGSPGSPGPSPGEMERGERFLAAYHSIERTLRRLKGEPQGRESFRQLVLDVSKQSAATRRFSDDLAEFGELRNAIVHERVTPESLIAIPLPETVTKIEAIARLLADPPKVYPLWQRDVISLPWDATMGQALFVLQKTGYSQFPVYRDDEYLGLLTDGGIARWVAKEAAREGASLDSILEARVGSVQKATKDAGRAAFIERDAPRYLAEEMFRGASPDRARSISAIFITQDGRSDQALLGIITPSDILAAQEEGSS